MSIISWLEERSMSEADEYRQFANDCIVWARIATSDDQRAHLLELAKKWEADATELERAKAIQKWRGQEIDPQPFPR